MTAQVPQVPPIDLSIRSVLLVLSLTAKLLKVDFSDSELTEYFLQTFNSKKHRLSFVHCMYIVELKVRLNAN